jgi:hypothetical protein
MGDCAECRGTRHIYDQQRRGWLPCSCLAGHRRAALMRAAGVDGDVPPASAFGGTFGVFVRMVVDHPGPSVLYGELPALEEAARCAVVTAVEIGHSAQLVTLDRLVDDLFERERKHRRIRMRLNTAFLAVMCGVETPHKWNAPVLSRLVLQRRYRARPTLLATTNHTLAELYGRAAKDMMRGLAHVPEHQLRA